MSGTAALHQGDFSHHITLATQDEMLEHVCSEINQTSDTASELNNLADGLMNSVAGFKLRQA